METNYHYTQLNKDQQSVYFALLEGLKRLSPSFAVPRTGGQEIFDVFFRLRLDHPEIFYAECIRYRYYDNSSFVEVTPTYLFDKKKIKTHQQAMYARVEKLKRPAMHFADEEKVLYIHDFICRNVHYDKLKKQYSHEIIGPLGQGVGVCEGIAKSVKILCDALDLWCAIAVSEANPEKGIKYRHAWNILRLNGMYVHLDVTFDLSLSKNDIIRYDYCFRSDSWFFRDHESLVWTMPSCGDDHLFYYRKKKFSFTKTEDVEKSITQYAKKGKTLIFHWQGSYLTGKLLENIAEMAEKSAAEKKKSAEISVNIPQSVIRINFCDQPKETQITDEDIYRYME
ncbi:MAG: transglutaminase domain-containing protein [Clostridia bacterium]